MSNYRKAVTWMLAIVFLASGGAKLAGLEFEFEAFERWGYPRWFVYFAGAVEVAGALGLMIRRLSALAASGLALFMLGAIGTHLVHQEWAMLVLASALTAAAAWLAWTGRRDIRIDG